MPPSEQERRLTELRRMKVIELLSKGYRNNSEIGRLLNVSDVTVGRNIKYFRDQAQQKLQDWITNQIPMAVNESMVLLDLLMRKCFEILDKLGDSDHKTKLSVISMMKELQLAKTQVMSDASIARELLRVWKQKQDSIMALDTNASAADEDDDTNNHNQDTEIDDTDAEVAEETIEK